MAGRVFLTTDAAFVVTSATRSLVASFLFVTTQYDIPFKLSISTFHVSVS